LSDYFWIHGSDQRVDNWLLFDIAPKKHVKPSYAHLQCPKCGKVDELAAVSSGVERGIRIHSRRNWVVTEDGILCVRRKTFDTLLTVGAKGLEPVVIPDDDRWLALLPTVWAHVDMVSSGIELHDQCDHCGRYRETLYAPRWESVALPRDEMSFVAPDSPDESIMGRRMLLMCHRRLREMIESVGASGLEFLP
jgi:hypothetical protein